MAVEATSRRRAYFPYYGDGLALGPVTNKRGEPVSTYDGATLTVTVVEGDRSGRVYELTVLVDGPHIRDEAVVTFDYDVTVDVQPPLTAATAR